MLSQTNEQLKENFLNKAVQLLVNIMEISFPVYHEFLKNYPKAMTILNKLEKSSNAPSLSIQFVSKRKSFIECQLEFNKLLRDKEVAAMAAASAAAQNSSSSSSSSSASTAAAAAAAAAPSSTKKSVGFLSKFTPNSSKTTSTTASSSSSNKSTTTNSNNNKDPFNIYYGDSISRRSADEKFDIARMLSEDILRRPTKLFEFTCSLKDECMLAAKELSRASRLNFESNIKSLFENESSKRLREQVFDEINRNIMPIEVRKSEHVVELIESNNERKLRYLILYGDCLACCRLKK